MKESPGIALITGSGRRRVGNVVARALAEQGYSIALHYHSSEEAARESVEELRGLGIDSESYQANVAAESDVDAMFDQIIERFGRIDVLVTTASVWETGRLEEVSAEDLLRNFNVNTLGTFLCARRAGLAMCHVVGRDLARNTEVIDRAVTITIQDKDRFFNRRMFGREIQAGDTLTSRLRRLSNHFGRSRRFTRNNYRITTQQLAGRESHRRAIQRLNACSGSNASRWELLGNLPRHSVHAVRRKNCFASREHSEYKFKHATAPWEGRVVTLTEGKIEPKQNETLRYAGVPGMSAVCKQLATGIDIQFQTRVAPPTMQNGAWRLQDEDGRELGNFHYAIAAAPAPQTADLLAAAPELQHAARNVEMSGCWAVATQYGYDRQIRWKPPMVEEMKVEDGRIVLRMDEAVAAVDDGGSIEGFAIAGTDQRFHPADATHLITGKDERGRDETDPKALVLTSPLVPQPMHYRYAWARSPLGNLQASGNTDIPLTTQRSDDWSFSATYEALVGKPSKSPGVLDRGEQGELTRVLRAEDIRRRLAEAEAFIREHPQPQQ